MHMHMRILSFFPSSFFSCCLLALFWRCLLFGCLPLVGREHIYACKHARGYCQIQSPCRVWYLLLLVAVAHTAGNVYFSHSHPHSHSAP